MPLVPLGISASPVFLRIPFGCDNVALVGSCSVGSLSVGGVSVPFSVLLARRSVESKLSCNDSVELLLLLVGVPSLDPWGCGTHVGVVSTSRCSGVGSGDRRMLSTEGILSGILPTIQYGNCAIVHYN